MTHQDFGQLHRIKASKQTVSWRFLLYMALFTLLLIYIINLFQPALYAVIPAHATDNMLLNGLQ